MYIIQTRAQIPIPKFPLVTTVSWLPSRCRVRLAPLSRAPGPALCLCSMPTLAANPLRKQVLGSGEGQAKSLSAPERGGSLVRSAIKNSGNIWESAHFTR